MTMHALHRSIHEHGLADDCPRCTELAQRPTRTLDPEMLGALLIRTEGWVRGHADCEPRSVNERTAMTEVARTTESLIEEA